MEKGAKSVILLEALSKLITAFPPLLYMKWGLLSWLRHQLQGKDLCPEEDQSIWSKRRQGFQPCYEAGIREPTPSFTIQLLKFVRRWWRLRTHCRSGARRLLHRGRGFWRGSVWTFLPDSLGSSLARIKMHWICPRSPNAFLIWQESN